MVWLYTLVGFALTAIGSFVLVGNGRGWSVSLGRRSLYGIPVFLEFQPHERIFYDVFAPGIFGEMGLHQTKLEKMARSAVIQR